MTASSGYSGRLGWPPFAGLMLVIAGQGQAPGDCALNASSTITGLEYGSATLSTVSSGTTSINFLSCPSCIFDAGSSFSGRLPYSCQSIIVGVATTDALGAVQLQSIAVPPVQGQLLSTLAWPVTPLLQVISCPVWCRGVKCVKVSETTDPDPRFFVMCRPSLIFEARRLSMPAVQVRSRAASRQLPLRLGPAASSSQMPPA